MTDRYRLVNIFLGMLILFKLYQHPFPEDEMDKLAELVFDYVVIELKLAWNAIQIVWYS